MAKAQPKKKLLELGAAADAVRVGGIQIPKAEVLADYQLAFMSRHASVLGRKEVLSGKAKFGIFGDGKEVAQLAMAKAFRPGDWRSGYYRDQTFMFAVGGSDIKKFFAQLYADTDLEHEPASGGRQMNSHYASRYLDANGNWLNQLMMPNTSADMSPTAGQMARLVGLGYASKLYRGNEKLAELSQFSVNGNEVAFGTIGNASAAEGIFWEALNACGVLQIPVAISVWDDDYGISVPNKYQMTKESISEAAAGFRRGDKPGYDIYVVKAWDYPALVETYARAIERVRKEHVPALIHVIEVTQPQGHSTSGSHERYKSPERLKFEVEMDCLRKMREWILQTGLATAEALDGMERAAMEEVERLRAEAWDEYLKPIAEEREQLIAIYDQIGRETALATRMEEEIRALRKAPSLMRRLLASSARRSLYDLRETEGTSRRALIEFVDQYQKINQDRYGRWLHSETHRSPQRVEEIAPVYDANPEKVQGFEVIQRHWDHLMGRDPRVFIVGEDVGVLGCVNQGFKGLQEKYGEIRITDTGIREATILGQGIGAAMRGLRPVVDIQYLDYLLYAFQVMSDDLATLHYRSAGGQIAPVCVRTKGHRLEGIWHSGSPMGVIINGLRGMHVCVPRDMVQAVGMYNTIFRGDDPALVIEVLNGYRIREAVPSNLHDFTVPLGVPEVLREGSDLTLVTYGACVRIAEDAIKFLAERDISVELIDVRTLLPFDKPNVIGQSIAKTGAVLFLDEDVPGGAAAYMMQQTLDRNDAFDSLDAKPRCLSGQHNRPAYASDADYWAKPSVEDVIDTVYDMLRERAPYRYPARN
jgi:pyruvate/2-oxoglutarate/acetoin dehydrogenase E1 component/TPP-dependent pyruvate/acetoin dehydrogenase alpha subunit